MIDDKEIHNEAVDATCYLADFIMMLELKREKALYLRDTDAVELYSAELDSLRDTLSIVLREF